MRSFAAMAVRFVIDPSRSMSSQPLVTVRIGHRETSHAGGTMGWSSHATRFLWGRLPDQGELARHGHGFGAANSSEFAEDVAHVTLDRIERHDEFVGDLGVAPTHNDHFQNFYLPSGQGFA